MTAIVRSGRLDTAHHITLDRGGIRSRVRTLCGRDLTVGWSSEKIGEWLPVVCGRCATSFNRRDERGAA